MAVKMATKEAGDEKKARRPRSAQEPQPPENQPAEYDPDNHQARSLARKAHETDPLQTLEGVRDYKADLVAAEGNAAETPIPRGLPLVGEEKQRDERRRGIVRASQLSAPVEGSEEEVVLVELCPPLKTFGNLKGDLYHREEGPFKVTVEKAKELFALRNDMRQPLFRNYRKPVSAQSTRTASGRYVNEVRDETPQVVNPAYDHILRRQRPNAQADEDETVMTQRGLVSRGRADVDYGERETMDNREELATRDRTPRRRATDPRPAAVPERSPNSGDIHLDDLHKGGGVKV